MICAGAGDRTHPDSRIVVEVAGSGLLALKPPHMEIAVREARMCGFNLGKVAAGNRWATEVD